MYISLIRFFLFKHLFNWKKKTNLMYTQFDVLLMLFRKKNYLYQAQNILNIS